MPVPAIIGAMGTAAASAAASGAVSAATSIPNNEKKYRYWLKQQDELERRQIAAEKRQFDYNKDLQDYVYRQNLDQWNRENQYNSPLAQMQRFSAAGLNANLVYNNQSLSASSPEMSIGDVGTGTPSNASPLDIDGISIDPAIMQRLINETRLADANVENIQADTDKKKEETENVSEDTRGKKIENDFRSDINPIYLEKESKELDKIAQQVRLIDAQVKNTNLDSALKRYEQQLKELDLQIRRVDASHADELMALRLKKENAQISFVNHQIALVAKQIASYDDELKARLALSAAETLSQTAFANLSDSRTSYQDYVNKMNEILLDPTSSTSASDYWSALLLKNLSETSFLDVISEIRKWLGISSFDGSTSTSSSSSSSSSTPTFDPRTNPVPDAPRGVPPPSHIFDWIH